LEHWDVWNSYKIVDRQKKQKKQQISEWKVIWIEFCDIEACVNKNYRLRAYRNMCKEELYT
jgi:hypothetical protein